MPKDAGGGRSKLFRAGLLGPPTHTPTRGRGGPLQRGPARLSRKRPLPPSAPSEFHQPHPEE